MNPDEPSETPAADHIVCLIEYLRKPDARLNVSGEFWSMCWGKGDPLNLVIADQLAGALTACNPEPQNPIIASLKRIYASYKARQELPPPGSSMGE